MGQEYAAGGGGSDWELSDGLLYDQGAVWLGYCLTDRENQVNGNGVQADRWDKGVPQGAVGATGCRQTDWTADSAVVCLAAPGGAAASLRLVVTVEAQV